MKNLELQKRVDKYLNKSNNMNQMYLKDFRNGQFSMNYINTHEVVNYFKNEKELEEFLNEAEETQREINDYNKKIYDYIMSN